MSQPNWWIIIFGNSLLRFCRLPLRKERLNNLNILMDNWVDSTSNSTYLTHTTYMISLQHHIGKRIETEISTIRKVWSLESLFHCSSAYGFNFSRENSQAMTLNTIFLIFILHWQFYCILVLYLCDTRINKKSCVNLKKKNILI